MTTTPQQDPQEQGPKPPQPAQPQEPPGSSEQMRPQPDYGEQSYKGSGKLAGRAALITGADSGIGRAVALAFAREGADVLISYLSEDEDAQETSRLVTEAGRKAVTVPGDISEESHCKQLVGRVLHEFGRLDILVNNAAFQMTHEKITEIPSEEWDHTFRTNIYAMFYLCKEALPQMEEGGAIINTGSIQAYQPSSSLLAYAATKGAIVNFTKALAQEAIEQGIRVNSVAPGPVWTPLIPSTMPQEQVEKFGQDTLIKRPAQPAELAPVYVLLASQDGRYITGQVYGVTGGDPLV
ncbi:MAG: SDR family oxidoreductase [Armatimonadetes bacterium]|nr:SDR family oxidoreductase [Armatimonadota bacterium]